MLLTVSKMRAQSARQDSHLVNKQKPKHDVDFLFAKKAATFLLCHQQSTTADNVHLVPG